jgi:lipid-A-disaccharide synthase
MRRLVDHVLSALPFEHDWFLAQGMASTLVGHPFFDELRAAAADAFTADSETVAAAPPAAPAARPLVLLLPGSRTQEIEANLTTILRAAVSTALRVPETRFVVATLHERHAARVRAEIQRLGPALAGLDLEIVSGRARSMMRSAACAIAVSGSVSLELLAARVPTVIVYRISGLAHLVQSRFRHARFITLVNLLAAREPVGPTRPAWLPPREVAPADPEAIFPEYLTVQDPSGHVARHVVDWLTRPETRAAVVARLDEVARPVAGGGSADRAAEAVLALAGRSERRRRASDTAPGEAASRPDRRAA